MKTAYELAMERLNKVSPSVALTPEQKEEIAALEKQYAAKIAEREIVLKGEIAKAIAQGDLAAQEKWEREWNEEKATLLAKLEEKKEAVRRQGKAK